MPAPDDDRRPGNGGPREGDSNPWLPAEYVRMLLQLKKQHEVCADVVERILETGEGDSDLDTETAKMREIEKKYQKLRAEIGLID